MQYATRGLALGVKGLEAPTARHADGPVQATPIRAAPWAPGGFGVGWMCHTRPFHRSATVVPIPEGPKETPVVVQAEGDVQDTGPMMTPSAPAGDGMGRIFQVWPFQRSASGFGLGVLRPEPPNGHAERSGGARHAAEADARRPRGIGVAWIRHRVPFHRSASDTLAPELFW